ncbi:type II secretion system protein [bacterium]|nr:type II secretion system protein [bacterium]
MTKRFGFTLAEVLITLGIIGVVAAMTIPTLIANTNGAKFRSQFKKSISTLNQAGLMSQAQYDFDYAGTSAACNATVATAAAEHPESTMTFCAILNGTLTGQTYVGAPSNIKRNNNGTEAAYAFVSSKTLKDVGDYLAYTLADGSIVAFYKDAKACELPIGTQLTDAVIGDSGALKDCVGFIDVNGATLPNKEVTCTDDTKNTAANLLKVQEPCAVKNDANHMTDIFPIVFHDATVEPASAAAKYVLTTSK